MKVLFVASVFRHFTTFHIPYMQLLQKSGYEVWAAAYQDPAEKQKLEALGIKCVNIEFSRSPFSRKNLIAHQQLKQLEQSQYFDLIHVHTPVAAFLTRFVFRKKKATKIIYTAHGFHFFKGSPKLNWLIFFSAERLAQKWTNGLIVMNDEDYQNAKRLGYKKEAVFFVHGVGVEIPEYSKEINEVEVLNLKKELEIDSESIVISFIAELNDNKNHQFLLRNWSVIASECSDVVLLLIGKGEKEQELREYVDKHLSNVKFLGYRRDVPDLLKITDIVTLLSKREGLPKSIMEAMAQKIPCVVTNTRGLRDLIQDGENGYVVEHEDDKQLQRAFITLIKDTIKRRQMGERTFELVKQYNLKNVLKEYESIYSKYLNLDSAEKRES